MRVTPPCKRLLGRTAVAFISLATVAGCGGSSSSEGSPAPTASSSSSGSVQVAAVADQTVDELTSLSIPLSVGSATGVTFTATGLPAGVAVAGSTLGGTVSAAASNVTTNRKAVATQKFAISITAADAGGKTATSSFSLTVRDTHTVMPNYIGKYGCGGSAQCTEKLPNVAALTTPSFSCYAGTTGQAPEGSIWRQSIPPGTAIRWGAPAQFWYFQPTGSNCENVKKGW